MGLDSTGQLVRHARAEGGCPGEAATKGRLRPGLSGSVGSLWYPSRPISTLNPSVGAAWKRAWPLPRDSRSHMASCKWIMDINILLLVFSWLNWRGRFMNPPLYFFIINSFSKGFPRSQNKVSATIANYWLIIIESSHWLRTLRCYKPQRSFGKKGCSVKIHLGKSFLELEWLGGS